MEWATLCVIWFVLEGVLLAGYAVLDGFDLGVGILHPFDPRDDHAADRDELHRPAVGR
jgi:cytochrome d ubiquinol oxidase subunit II